MRGWNERSVICAECIGRDPMQAEWSGWLGDCPYWLNLRNEDGTRQTCGYGCYDEPQCQTCCPGIEPDGWGPDPGPEPCWECGGLGVRAMIRDTSPQYARFGGATLLDTHFEQIADSSRRENVEGHEHTGWGPDGMNDCEGCADEYWAKVASRTENVDTPEVSS